MLAGPVWLTVDEYIYKQNKCLISSDLSVGLVLIWTGLVAIIDSLLLIEELERQSV